MGKTFSKRVRVGREYLRVSLDRSGRERSQDEENAGAAEDHGIALGPAYREAGSASASRYSQKVRDDFQRLLSDLENGRFNADVLVLWESSRGSRKVSEWCLLIDLCEAQGVTFFVTTHGREYDPGNPRDRRFLQEDAVDSEYESAKVSLRATRSAAATAREGKPHGRVPYGYVRRYDQRTGRLAGQDIDEGKAHVIRDLFDQLIKGKSLLEISRNFAAKGYCNLKGASFSPGHLRVFATNPAYAGIRSHQTVKRNEKRRNANLKYGTNRDAIWTGLISREDFMTVQRILDDPKRVTTRPGGAKHLVSMIAKCDRCGTTLAVTFRDKSRPDGAYQCRNGGHVRCDKPELDDIAEKAVLAYLGRPDVYADFTAGQDQDSTELNRVRGDLAAARQELNALRVKVGTGKVSAESLEVAEPMIVARIAALVVEEDILATPSALRGLITPGEDVADRWAEMTIASRRALMRVLLVPERLGELRVLPRSADFPRSVSQPVRDRVIWVRQDRQPPPTTLAA